MPDSIVRISSASAFIPGDKKRSLVLRDIDLNVGQAVTLAISGANGSGKSSLLNLIHGVLRPCKGSIAWRQHGVYDESAITGQEITALVSPQLQALCQWQQWPVTAQEIIAGGRTGASLASAVRPEPCLLAEINELMERFAAVNLLALTLPQLSQGQLRLVLLARALIKKPSLLLLDEWADGLDAKTRNLAESVLGGWAGKIAMIFTGHREETFPEFVTGNYYMAAGRLHEGRQQLAAIKTAAVQEATVNSGDPATPPLLALQNVSVYIDRELALKNISFTLRKGEHWRINGANGSGKSTFLRLLAGDELVAAGGSLRQYSAATGCEVNTLAGKRASVCLVSDLSQACYGYNLTGLELVLSGLDNSIGLYRIFSKEEEKQAWRLLGIFFADCAEIGHASIRRLSHGQLRRLFLARAMLGKPEILLLDEPCTGLDPQSRADFLNLLDSLAHGRLDLPAPQIILTTHAEEDVPLFINRQARLENGQLFLL